jgi:hypothetical protein
MQCGATLTFLQFPALSHPVECLCIITFYTRSTCHAVSTAFELGRMNVPPPTFVSANVHGLGFLITAGRRAVAFLAHGRM